jgi:hypothetical protein
MPRRKWGQVMTKVSFFDRRVSENFQKCISGISTTLSLVVLFFDIPTKYKTACGGIFLGLLLLIYLAIWMWSNNLNKIDINVEGSHVTIKVGDIFQQPGLKVIAFNEYFDTKVDNKMIAEGSLNGIFIQQHLDVSVSELDHYIESYDFKCSEILESKLDRGPGKKVRHQIGTICVYKNDFLLTAFSKFDENNSAVLTMPEYLEFLINFWDKVNKVYAQQSVTTPIFGSGITRIKGHKNISDEDLLKIMLWTFRISEMRFKYPAKLTIVIHKDKIDKINLLDIKSTRNGV